MSHTKGFDIISTMDGNEAKKTSYTFELTNDQQEILLGIMVNGNYRRREVPYSLYSIEPFER